MKPVEHFKTESRLQHEFDTVSTAFFVPAASVTAFSTVDTTKGHARPDHEP
jgi:hypothetical protein